ncbi:hypothetical protein PInf_010144 [Phytophthora infestans]|nr:hypothetical protein PInf_010144 [Phytophthora infestans]
MVKYRTEVKAEAVALVRGGVPVSAVAERMGILKRTIRKWVQAATSGKSLEPARRGPRPLLPEEAERHIYEWVVGRQLVGFPADRHQFLRKAQEVALLVCGRSVGDGWYRRFMERHPTLATE